MANPPSPAPGPQPTHPYARRFGPRVRTGVHLVEVDSSCPSSLCSDDPILPRFLLNLPPPDPPSIPPPPALFTFAHARQLMDYPVPRDRRVLPRKETQEQMLTRLVKNQIHKQQFVHTLQIFSFKTSCKVNMTHLCRRMREGNQDRGVPRREHKMIAAFKSAAFDPLPAREILMLYQASMCKCHRNLAEPVPWTSVFPTPSQMMQKEMDFEDVSINDWIQQCAWFQTLNIHCHNVVMSNPTSFELTSKPPSFWEAYKTLAPDAGREACWICGKLWLRNWDWGPPRLGFDVVPVLPDN